MNINVENLTEAQKIELDRLLKESKTNKNFNIEFTSVTINFLFNGKIHEMGPDGSSERTFEELSE